MNRKREVPPNHQPTVALNETQPAEMQRTMRRRQSANRRPQRWVVFAAANILFLLMVATASLINDSGSVESITYLALLFLICSSPLVMYDKLNGRYTILLVLMPLFFWDYGLYDLAGIFSLFRLSADAQSRSGLLSEAELAILIGGLMLIIGYVTVASLWNRRSPNLLRSDWKLSTITLLGIVTWAAGGIGTLVWNLKYVDTMSTTSLSAVYAMTLTLLRMIQPIGAALIIYAYIVSKSRFHTILVIAMIAIDFMLGFANASKELMIRSLALLIAANFLIRGTVPKKWLLIGAGVVAFSFSIMQAYRYEILQTEHQTRLEALSHLETNLVKAFDSKMVGGDVSESSAKLVVGRTNLKSNMELIVSRVGKTVPYQYGHTIGILAYAFVPRFLMPDKPDSSVGQLFTRTFHTSADPNTFTSVTQMGDLYWNFGWVGLVVGMLLIGALLGAVGAGANLSQTPSVTRLLVILSTVYLVCLRFEDGIALQYTLWIRSMVVIFLLHMAFRRRLIRRNPALRATQLNKQIGAAK